MRFASLVALIVALAAAGCGTFGHVEPYRDVVCFGRAKISLSDAIEAAGKANRGPVIDAEYNIAEEMGCERGNPGRYDLTLIEDGRLDRVSVDAGTGQLGPLFHKKGPSGLMSFDTPAWPRSEMRAGARNIAKAPITLLAAIAATKATGFNAMAAHVTTVNGKTDYAIELVEAGRVRMVYVDSVSGRLRK